jgi:hypothetical protein
VAGAITSLEKHLKISAESSVLNQPLPPPMNPEDLFQK